MKDTQVEAVVAPAGITVEEGGDWKFVTLASRESRLLASKILPTPSAVFCYPKSGEDERWAFLSAPPRPTVLLLDVRGVLDQCLSSRAAPLWWRGIS
jgi:hypothetical protein